MQSKFGILCEKAFDSWAITVAPCRRLCIISPFLQEGLDVPQKLLPQWTRGRVVIRHRAQLHEQVFPAMGP
jgi:hypothetical protein